MSTRRFYVKFNGKKSRWRNQKNGLPQGSILSPVLPQHSTFEQTETILAEALHNLGAYYARNHLRATPDKTQICAFHLKNQEASRKLNITWYNKHLEHITNPVYMGVTLDRTLRFIQRAQTQTEVQNIRSEQYP